MVVMKFGGTSVADAAAIRRVVGIVSRQPEPSFVVVSAMAGVTDRLLEAARLAGCGDEPAAVRVAAELRERHEEAAAAIADAQRREDALDEIDRVFWDLRSLLHALGVLREVSPRSLDAVAAAGELANSRLLAAALATAGFEVRWLDPRQVVVTDDRYTAAAPMHSETAIRLAQLARPHLDAPGRRAVVMGGFVGATRSGVTTTLGRGGSDYSAAIVGAALGASEIQIWTDVDGMLTADPRLVADARPVPRLSAGEAAELAYFGAKVLHPSTIAPAMARGIPVRILNSYRPDAPGSIVTTDAGDRTEPLAAIACKRGLTVVEITSNGMLMACGFLRRLFEVFERFETPVDVVTTSEVSVSVTIDDDARLAEILAAIAEFAEVASEPAMAIVCLVGEGLRTDGRLAGRVLGALEGVKVRMLSQAASRRNLTFVLPEAEVADAMTRLHARFFGAGAPAAAEPTAHLEPARPLD